MHKIFEELREDASYSEICEMKEKLIEGLKSEINSKGISQIDTMEVGQVVDMIKDLAEAEKCCMEACYYKTIIKAMEEDDDDGEDRRGYNNRRYESGRYAPKGRGRVMGYRPYFDKEPYLAGYLNDPDFDDIMRGNVRMGYPNDMEPFRMDNRRTSDNKRGYDDDWDDEYGRPYNEYRKAKRYFTETKSMNDKQRMEEHANKHMNETIGTFREIWKDADPNMKKKMKADLTTLVNEMNV